MMSGKSSHYFCHCNHFQYSLLFVTGKQFSLDSRMDLVVQGIDPSIVKNGVEEKAITEDCEDSWEGTKGR
jgi:hypothetical protein